MLNTHECAWAAGFFDGEGYTLATDRARTKTGHQQRYSRLSASISQVDPKALHRFHKAVQGRGRILGPYQNKNPKSQPFYVFSTTSFEDVQFVICCLWPWLGPLKRAQAKTALQNWLARPRQKAGQRRSLQTLGKVTIYRPW